MKHFRVVILSLFLLNAGVAWALQSCLHLHDHFDHNGSLGTEPHRADDLLFSDSADRLDSDPHCAYLHFEIDPGISTTITQAGLFPGGAALIGSASLTSVAQSETKDLWLRSVFRRFSSFLALRGLSHHLFFSVLQI